MSDNLQNHDNAASDDSIGGLIRELKIDKNNTNNNNNEAEAKAEAEAEEIVVTDGVERVAAVAESHQYPNRPNEPDCIYYLRTGSCGYGNACKFNHPPLAPADVNATAATVTDEQQGVQDKGGLPQRTGQPDCGYFLKTGSCKYGSTCKYHHPKDRAGAELVPLNTFGLPMREGEKSCPYYLRTFTCKFGAVCKFHHPQPASLDNVLSSPASGAMCSGCLNTTNLPYVGGVPPYAGVVPTWSLPKPQYLPGSRVSGPNNYMPSVYPPQGMMAAQGWGTYVGNLNPVVTLGYSPKSDGQLDFVSSDYLSLPVRPDQPECRYFMSNGSCKYGSGCKYHHPKERIAQLAMNMLGPHGLPLRPGQAMCTHFSAYGVCRYGPTCRFDHPVAGYFSNYGFGFPSQPMFDQSLHPYQGSSLIKHSSGTSPKSVKTTEWIKKPETVEVKQNSDADSLEDQHGHVQPDSSEVHG